MRVITKQRNKPRLPGNKIDKGFINNQGNAALMAVLHDAPEQGGIGLLTGRVVGGAQKQAVNLLIEYREQRLGGLKIVGLIELQVDDVATDALQRPAILGKARHRQQGAPRAPPW